MTDPVSPLQATLYLACAAGWVAACRTAVVRARLRQDPARFESLRFVIVASAGAAAGLCGLVLTGHWMDLMSQPQPTPVMVAKDLASTATPILSALGGAYLASAGKLPVLTVKGTHGRHAA